ncbi:MAG: hypothetical protein EXX96DRAFT_525684 [Benjaminiella poitrasii]|nr:MAG: hypothetical protein EXX96DRAFT_525684 [Benjaminiella poitrasii]
MTDNLELEGQTAPESTRGLFDSETTLKKKDDWTDKRRSIELSPHCNTWFSSSKLSQQPSRNIGLRTVNEEDMYNQRRGVRDSFQEDEYRPPSRSQRDSFISTTSSTSSSLFSSKQHASVTHFNSFPISKQRDYTDDDSKRMSRADVLAETEAKLSGQSHITITDRLSSQLSLVGSAPNSRFHNTNRIMSSDKPSRRLSAPTGTRNDQYSVRGPLSNFAELDSPQQQRFLSNGASTINKRMSFLPTSSTFFQQQEEGSRRSSRSGFSEFERRSLNHDWRSRSPKNSQPIIPNSPTSSRRHSMAGSITSSHRLSTGSMGNFESVNGSQRKPLFISHLPFSSVLPSLKSYQLVCGLLRVNKRNRSDAYVFCEEINADVYICGSRDRNRALEGDLVAVKLIEVEQVMLEKHEKEEAKVARNNGQPVIRTPDEEDEKEIIFGGEEDVDLVTPEFCGIVVAIMSRAQKQVFSGTLGLTRPSNKRPKGVNDETQQHRDSSVPRIIWFKPTDKRVPLIAIPVEQAPAGFIENSESFDSKLFLGTIKRWPITSLHPFGVLEGELGHVEDTAVQLKAILADNNLTAQPYSEFLSNYNISIDLLSEHIIEREIENDNRRDMRLVKCITIVDEEGCFLENALSIESIDNTLQVGLHVADITAFVDLDSVLDREGRTRGIDVFHTAFERVSLWPEELREKYTDLVENEDRLAFSVIWTVSDTGDIQNTWYGKTVINSDAVVTDEDLQSVIDGIDDEKYKDIKVDILKLYTVSKQLLHRRKEEALFIKSPQIDIQFRENCTPSHISPKRYFDSHLILQEFQILANKQVAQKISSHFPDHALLQCQAPPNKRKMQELVSYISSLGYIIHPESPSSLQKSIDAIENEDARSVIISLVMKTMSQEKYFCTGSFDISRYQHYSTNMPLYTHFTSPTKHYTDVIVHRLLDACLQNDSYFPMDTEVIQKISLHCNVKVRAVNNAREQTQHMFLAYYLANNTRNRTSRIVDAIVVGVQEGAFDVIVPGLCLERRIHTINLPLRSSSYSPSENMLHLVWIQGKATVDATIEATITLDVDVRFIDHSNTGEEDSPEEDDILIDIDDTTANLSPSQIKRLSNKSSISASTSDEIKIKTHRRSTSIRAIKGEDAWLTQKECTFPNECRQLIRPFDFVKVVVTADPIRSPPLVRVLAANPFITI